MRFPDEISCFSDGEGGLVEYSYEVIFLWDFLMIFHAFWADVISLLDFMPFGPCPKHGCFKTFGGLMGNMLRRGESSWLCMKLEFAFVAGTAFWAGIFRLLFRLSLWKNSASLSCLVVLMRFTGGIFMHIFWPLWDSLMRFPAFGCMVFLSRFVTNGYIGASALGDRGVCVDVVWFVCHQHALSPACIVTPSRYVCLRMT